jgi:hypothetical protein
MNKPIAIKIDNEREFRALMKYYEDVREWCWQSGCAPKYKRYAVSDRYIRHKDRFTSFTSDDYDEEALIIPFAHLAALEGIELEPEEVIVDLTNLMSAIVKSDRIDFTPPVAWLDKESIEKIYTAIKSFES